ncbi:unnamed protein product [Rhizoctonia solani]|uniref:Uncharacterized protein n=1 Tax=Rhizoctonia solani TaxID=456999 RepID=A0A8H2Y4H2_9AGAM|nr:unnamed protein product [Rhizoctonia solani]
MPNLHVRPLFFNLAFAPYRLIVAMLYHWRALLALAMGTIDRLRVHKPQATGTLSQITGVDSRIEQTNQQANLVHLYGFPRELSPSYFYSFQGTGVQTYTRLEPEYKLPAVEPLYGRSESLASEYSIFSVTLNDTRPAFGKHSPRIEEEIARWLALLHEIGILFTIVQLIWKLDLPK